MPSFQSRRGDQTHKKHRVKAAQPTPTAPLESLCPLHGGGGYVRLRGADWPWGSFGCIPSFFLSSSQRPSEVSCVSLTAPRCSPPLSSVTLRATPTACCHCLVCVWRGSRGRLGAHCHHSWEPLGHPSSSLPGREETKGGGRCWGAELWSIRTGIGVYYRKSIESWSSGSSHFECLDSHRLRVSMLKP